MAEDQHEVNREAPDLISVGAQTLVDNARRLGLTWQLRPATVEAAKSADLVTARYDGDETTIDMVSMIGLLSKGVRVYVIGVPPAGNFIVGRRDALSMRHILNRQDTSSTTASTTYVNLTNIAGTAFVAPESGIVTIYYTALMANDTATGGSQLTPRVGTGATVGGGTTVLAASNNNAIGFDQHATVNESMRFGGQYTLTGLLPGTIYNVSMQGRAITAGTATFQRIHTTVVPSP